MNEETVRRIVREELVKLLTMLRGNAEYWAGERREPMVSGLEDLVYTVTRRGYDEALRGHELLD